jgi:rare lipoprotein A
VQKLLLLFLLSTSLFALSKEERIIRASLSPYTVKNITYYPHKLSLGERKEIMASWYGEYFHGRLTALGEVYDMNGISAAHKTYPLGTILKVTNPANGKSIKVRINDRGPFWGNRELDLSKGAANYLETKNKGVAAVSIEVVFVPKLARVSAPVTRKSSRVLKLKALSKKKIVVNSYAIIEPTTTHISVKLGRFRTLKSAKIYKAEIKKYFGISYILKYNGFYGIKSYIPAQKKEAKKLLKRLKNKGLIEDYNLFWSYE